MSIIILCFHFRLFPGKADIKCFKKSKKTPILGAILELFAQISSIMNSPGKTGSVSF